MHDILFAVQFTSRPVPSLLPIGGQCYTTIGNVCILLSLYTYHKEERYFILVRGKNCMKSTTELKKGRNVVAIARRCHECKEEALGRCPDCHRGFCQDHFPKQQHSPCAERQMKLAQTQVCYVCGTPVYPDQWSLSRTSHLIDQYRCQGCGRHICD